MKRQEQSSQTQTDKTVIKLLQGRDGRDGRDGRTGYVGSIANIPGTRFFPVEGRCGSLPCPPYKETKELTCAVCTK